MSVRSDKSVRFEKRLGANIHEFLRHGKAAAIGRFMLYRLARPAVFALEAERAHRLTIAALRMLPASRPAPADPRLSIQVAGLTFPNPVGLAPGFDKDAEVPDAMLALGFGFAEVGTVTPLAQAGNPRPRLFRLVEDDAVVNRMGFNNAGGDVVAQRLKRRMHRPGVVGINIGANKDSTDRIGDYAALMRRLGPLAHYVTINISSPNTPGLRALQDREALEALLDAVIDARGDLACPLFLKLAPDLEPQDISDICRVATDKRLDGLIISNTTISRPSLASIHADETGGLSGAPLRDLAQQRLLDFRRELGPSIPLIGVGGIASAADAYARIRAGASLVQIYSAMVYAGPSLASAVNSGLLKLLERDGIANIASAVGVDADGQD